MGVSSARRLVADVGGCLERVWDEVLQSAGGQITYQLAGTQAGTETFSFTEYGNKTRRETHTSMEMMGISQRTDSVILTDGPWMYTLDPDKNQAIKRKNPMFGSFAEQSDLDRFKTGEDVMKALGDQNGEGCGPRPRPSL